jgi:fumarate hydratase class II
MVALSILSHESTGINQPSLPGHHSSSDLRMNQSSLDPLLTPPDVAAARQRHQTLSNELEQLRNTIRSNTETLAKMHDGYGPDAEWKKLEGTCVEQESGE